MVALRTLLFLQGWGRQVIQTWYHPVFQEWLHKYQ